MFCPACGNSNVPESLTCSKCGAALPVSTSTTPAMAPSTANSKAAPLIAGAPLAGIGDRAIAVVLDLVVVGAAFAVTGMWAAVRWGGATSNGFELNGMPALIAIAAVAAFGFLYVWLLEGVLGATLGKFMVNVRVRRTDGGAIGLQESLVRNLLRIIDGFALYLVGFLIAIFSRLKQRLGDHVAGTVVVQKDAGNLPRAVAAVVWTALIVTGCVGAYRLHSGAGAAVVASAPGTGSPVRSQTAPTQTAPVQTTPSQTVPVPAAGDARVTKAEMGTDSTPDFQIVNPSNEFYPDTAKIVCVWAVEGTDPSTTIKSVWIADDTGGAWPPNSKLAEKSFSGANEGTLYATGPNNGWPVGKYHLEIYIGDKLAKEVPFSIKPR
jgi:uncharacterized RDD family membrane protein YckC